MSGIAKYESPYDYSDDEYATYTRLADHDHDKHQSIFNDKDSDHVDKSEKLAPSGSTAYDNGVALGVALANGQLTSNGQSHKRSLLVRLLYRLEDSMVEINWLHVAYKICAYTFLALNLYFIWRILPVNGHWNTAHTLDKVPIVYQNSNNYFDNFTGLAECNIQVSDLYVQPSTDTLGNYAGLAFCPTRKALLEAMSTGGRIGFDAPYFTKGCEYRWYSVAEICMILERFDGVVFIGDQPLQTIYAGLNILLRQDLSHGALMTPVMDNKAINECGCDNQFVKLDCARHHVFSSEVVTEPIAGKPYVCLRTPHVMLHASLGHYELQSMVKRMLPANSKTLYKPIPVVVSVSPEVSVDGAKELVSGLLSTLESSSRKTPVLWIGPTAAGHVDVRGRKGNQEIWDFDRTMAQFATKNSVEVLGMWNMTVQANSYDGLHFGEKVAITQAMMVMNWLARLESS